MVGKCPLTADITLCRPQVCTTPKSSTSTPGQGLFSPEMKGTLQIIFQSANVTVQLHICSSYRPSQ